ncbi:YbhB/YbcL family Raf kinase inhibitor-like protein [Streptomyces hoynatensis]|uniref:YbhB/YbcL family Raf kinase inhibitor-like protein n=1 Tax=Streptomyces hoynatensis TaxID=1141874 RepID=A0A3A9YVC4_9ACTN|nr:YbhB/YbcL family Raf kinase inhibitor-like protein [Streptomyces hoynatensis]RKN39534.1 YbhB/YbcL family Raf kinase inhibitor-like protein [Streptomyces hoynatensis]
MAAMELQSTAFADQAPIPHRFAREGENISPPLTWSDPPAGTRELVLMCEDPDAPSGTFLHWLVTGIDPASRGVAAGDTPPGGTAHRNGFGDRSWDGPSPPPGDPAHRYRFVLYALPEPSELPDRVSAAQAHEALDGHRLAGAALTGYHRR